MTEQEIRAMRGRKPSILPVWKAAVSHPRFCRRARLYRRTDAHELVNRTRRRYGLESVIELPETFDTYLIPGTNVLRNLIGAHNRYRT